MGPSQGPFSSTAIGSGRGARTGSVVLRLPRRRTHSSSRAQEIVTHELKARLAQPDRPVHRPRDSLFSWSREETVNTAGLVNWGGLLLFLSGIRLVLENLLKYGVRVSASGWVVFLVGDSSQPRHYPLLYLLGALHAPLVTVFVLEVLLAHGVLSWLAALSLHCTTLLLLLLCPILFIHRSSDVGEMGLVSAVLGCSCYCIVFAKLVSYIQVNKWCRDAAVSRGNILHREKTFGGRARKISGVELEQDDHMEESERLVQYPANLTPRDLYYFFLAPTLCYELNFPRSKRIRKRFLLRRVLEVILGTHLMLALTQQWIIPNVVNSLLPFSRTDLPLATERLIRLALPNHVLWLLGGWLLFHSLLNISGELLQFADRDFYHDWWNSTNFAQFWQDWNLPIHKWFVRHLFKPMVMCGFSRRSAIFAVFLVSSFLHEYLVSVPLRMFKVWVFLGFMCNIPMVWLSKGLEEYLGPRAGNLSMWLFLIIGQPLLVMTYYHDYVIQHHGPTLLAYYGHLNSTSL